jgi:hypothetical protein
LHLEDLSVNPSVCNRPQAGQGVENSSMENSLPQNLQGRSFFSGTSHLAVLHLGQRLGRFEVWGIHECPHLKQNAGYSSEASEFVIE